MKTNTFQTLFLLFALLWGFSCSNPCKDVDCGNGICNKDNGGCTCNSGWLKDSTGKCSIQDVCYNKDCVNGTCNPIDASCVCNSGYEQDANGLCTIANSDKFVGTWNVVENCPSGTYNYDVNITKNDYNRVTIRNYGNYASNFGAIPVMALIDGNDISIPLQTISFNFQSFVINPTSSTFSNNTFTLNYSVIIDGNTTQTCSAVYTKQ